MALNIIMSSGRKQNKTDNFNSNTRGRLNEMNEYMTKILDEIRSLKKCQQTRRK